MDSTQEANTTMATWVIEVRKEGELQRFEEMKGDMLYRLGLKVILAGKTTVIGHKSNGSIEGKKLNEEKRK